MKGSLEKFWPVMTHVESLYKMVQKPREQVADVVALLDIANKLVTLVRSRTDGELTLTVFLTSLIKNSGNRYGGSHLGNIPNTKIWVDVGLMETAVTPTMVSLIPDQKSCEDDEGFLLPEFSELVMEDYSGFF
ncbi:putative Nse4/EID family protein [Dioscorea sansibarensis]